MYPQECHVVYLDSGSAKRKYYTHIKEVLDEALTALPSSKATSRHKKPGEISWC
jgi:hypothetical protein